MPEILYKPIESKKGKDTFSTIEHLWGENNLQKHQCLRINDF